MNKIVELTLRPEEAFDDDAFQQAIAEKLHIKSTDQIYIRPLRRSIDARGRQVSVNVSVELVPAEEARKETKFTKEYKDVSNAPKVIVVGSGPAGLFAALRLIELGSKPIVLERGKDVQARRRDLAAINKGHTVNPDSNYCFGEGGAGTYSDGKLYTRSKKRGDIKRILEIMVAHGAKEDILFDAHPHIGTNKLPKLVSELRESILQAGGEIHFDTKVTDLIIRENEMKGVITENGNKIEGESVILATGHSARDIFHLLHQHNVLIEAKPFALGVRVEHDQNLIDRTMH